MKLQIFGLILLLILSLRFFFFYSNQPQFEHGQKVNFTSLLFSEPQIFGSRQLFTANLGSHTRVRITTSRFPQLHYGEHIHIKGTISNSNNRLLIYFPEIKIIKNPSNPFQKFLSATSTIRQKLTSLFSTTLPSPSSSLLMGIIFGIKEQMPQSFSDNLKISGVYHVIAASGMNVTLIGGFISTFFAFFLKRQIAIGLSIIGIMFYALLGGLEASIVRASIMGILVFSAQIMGRQTLAINGLILAGFTMLFITPSLITDIGFQLSFTATLGILYIKRLPTTISAQIATLPILLANFGTYSVYSILVNALVLWTVPIIMAVGGIGALIGLIIIPLGQLIIYLSYPLLWYFEQVVNIFGKIGGVITIQTLPWQFIVGYYCLLSSALLIFRRKH